MEEKNDQSQKLGKLRKKVRQKIKWESIPHQKMSNEPQSKTLENLQIHQIELQTPPNEKLLKNGERFQAIFENSPVLINAFDANGQCILWNRACEQKFGWSIDEINSNPSPLALFYPDAEVRQKVMETITNPDGVFREWTPKTKKGEVVTCMWANYRLPNEMAISIGYDITDRKRAEEKFTHQQELLQGIYDKAPVLLVMYDPQMEKFALNHYAEKVLGWTTEEANQGGFAGKIFPDPAIKEDACQFMQSTKNGWHEWVLTTKSGEQVPINWAVNRLTDETMVVIGVDLRESKKAEQQLQNMLQEKQFLASVIERSSQAFAVGYPDGKIGQVNKAFENLTGYTAEELRQVDWNKKLTPDKWQKLETEKLAELCKTGKPVTYEKEYIRKDGSIIPVELLTNVSLKDDGKPLYYYAFVKDISERKQYERKLKTQRYYLTKAQEMGNIGTWELDTSNNKLIWTEQNYRIFGVPKGQPVMYETFLSIVHPDDREYVEEKWHQALGGKPYDIEHRIIVDGNVKWVREKADCQFNEQGKCISAIGFTQDITNKKLAEQQRENLNEMLKAKIEEFGHFFSVLRHDLGNPLLSVQAFSIDLARISKQISEMLKDQNIDPDVKKKLSPILDDDIPSSVDYIQTAVKQMNAILEGLKQIADIGRVPVNIEKLDMNKLIKDTTNGMKHRFKESGVSLTLDQLPHCLADSNQTQEVFINLLTNAVKYRHPERNAQIHISGKVEQDYCIYRVEDNGIGLTLEQQERIFEPFYRVSNQIDGEGLGLTIVAKILNRQNGKIWVESEHGKGSCFYVALPHP